jgi:hypothetical protein
MNPASGDEKRGVFQEKVRLALSRQAIQSLAKRNQCILQNPNRDFFSVRRFWIELKLEDGRLCSSDIATATYTQPPDWPYAEGAGIPFGQDITIDIWFP